MDNDIKLGKKKIQSLAGLKAIAMLLLFWWHGFFPLPDVDLGARSCDLLFVASGFLVGYNYYDKSIPATWKESVRYSVNKLINFWPLHFLTFVFCFFNKEIAFNGKTVARAIMNLSLLQAWSSSTETSMSFNGPSWFLSAILFCYFLSPFLLRFLKNIKLSGIIFVLAFVIRFFIEFVFKRYGTPLFIISIHTSPIVRSLDFFLGMLCVPSFFKIIKLTGKIKSSRKMICFSVAELLFITFTFFASIEFNEIIPRAFFILIFCVLVFVFAFDGGIISRFLALKPFGWFSAIQFEFFLLHGVIISICIRIFSNIKYLCDWRIMNVVVFSLIILFSFLYKKYLSKPLSAILKRGINKLFSSIGIGLTF